MGLMREIYAQLSDGEEGATGAAYTVWAKRGGYFQNVKKVLSFSPSQIELLSSSGRLVVSGKGLTVKKYFEDDLLLRGDIDSVSTRREKEE